MQKGEMDIYGFKNGAPPQKELRRIAFEALPIEEQLKRSVKSMKGWETKKALREQQNIKY